MQRKFTGIVIEVRRVGVDKQITLLTVENGLVNIIVENFGENILKFSYAKEVFTFGYFLASTQDNYLFTLEHCEIIDTFENLKKSTKKVEALNLIAVVKEIAQYNDQDTPLFYELVMALKTLNYENTIPNLVFAKLLSSICASFAKVLNFDLCASCQLKLKSPIYLNFENNVFVCPNCKSKNSARFNSETFEQFKTLLKTEYNNLANVGFKNINLILNILKENYRFKVSKRFKFYSE